MSVSSSSFTRLRLPVLVCTLGAALAAGAPAAQAIPNVPSPTPTPKTPYRMCSVTVPQQVAVSAPSTTITVRLASGCPAGATARWDLVDGSSKVVARFAFPPSKPKTFTVASPTALGHYTFVPRGASVGKRGHIGQNRPTMTVGARSRTDNSATRTRSTVAVTTTSTAYSIAAKRFAPRAKATVVLQKSGCAKGCAWTNAATATTDARGRATFAAVAPSGTYWRTTVKGTPTIWGSVSTTFRR